LLKVGLSLNKIHCYTEKSIHKTTYLNVFLGGLITFLEFRTKKPLQSLQKCEKSITLKIFISLMKISQF